MLRRRILATVTLLATGFALSACTTPVATPSASPTQGPTAPSTSEPSPSAGANDGIPVTISCDQLISPQAMYDYNPNFGLVEGFEPAPGSKAAEIVALRGLACRWVNQTSNEKIDVAVANLPHEHLESIANGLVTTSNSVPTYAVEGYFELNGSIGEANAISSPHWIFASSGTFFEPGDAQPIMAAAIAGLG